MLRQPAGPSAAAAAVQGGASRAAPCAVPWVHRCAIAQDAAQGLRNGDVLVVPLCRHRRHAAPVAAHHTQLTSGWRAGGGSLTQHAAWFGLPAPLPYGPTAYVARLPPARLFMLGHRYEVGPAVAVALCTPQWRRPGCSAGPMWPEVGHTPMTPSLVCATPQSRLPAATRKERGWRPPDRHAAFPVLVHFAKSLHGPLLVAVTHHQDSCCCGRKWIEH